MKIKITINENIAIAIYFGSEKENIIIKENEIQLTTNTSITTSTKYQNKNSTRPKTTFEFINNSQWNIQQQEFFDTITDLSFTTFTINSI